MTPILASRTAVRDAIWLSYTPASSLPHTPRHLLECPSLRGGKALPAAFSPKVGFSPADAIPTHPASPNEREKDPR